MLESTVSNSARTDFANNMLLFQGMERTHSHSKAPPNPAAGEAAAGADRGSVAGAKTPAAGTGAAEAVPASAPAPAATSTPSKKSSEKSSKLGKPKLSKAEVLRTAWGVTVSGRTLTKHQKGWDDGLVLLGCDRFICIVVSV